VGDGDDLRRRRRDVPAAGDELRVDLGRAWRAQLRGAELYRAKRARRGCEDVVPWTATAITTAHPAVA
jgi:hypothetical protein